MSHSLWLLTVGVAMQVRRALSMLTVTEAALLVLVVGFTFLTGSLGSISDPEPGLAHLGSDNVSLSHEGRQWKSSLCSLQVSHPNPAVS